MPVLQRLQRLAQLQARVRRSSFVDAQQEEIGGRMDRLACDVAGRAKLFENLEAKNQNHVAKATTLFTCSNIMVDVQSGSSYGTISTTPITLTYDAHGNVTNTFAYSTGNPGDIIILRVMYNWPVVGGGLLPGLANQTNGNLLLVATSVFKTEPY